MSSESSDSKKSFSDTKKEKPNLLPEQKLFWSSVENIFQRTGVVIFIISVLQHVPLFYVLIRILIRVWNGELTMNQYYDDVVGIFETKSLIYWMIVSVITITIPSCLYNLLGVLLFSSVICFCGYSILLFDFYQTTRDMELVYLSFAYTVFWITTPLLLLTQAFCSFALYKTRKIKIPRFYDGPDLYEVIYDAENSSTKWTRKLKSD